MVCMTQSTGDALVYARMLMQFHQSIFHSYEKSARAKKSDICIIYDCYENVTKITAFQLDRHIGHLDVA
jgi:hypothetical protein